MKHFSMIRVAWMYGFLTICLFLSAQTPTHYPTGQNKVDFNFVNILIYIVFPVLLVVIWRTIRNRKSQD
jgi:hypothetical protein